MQALWQKIMPARLVAAICLLAAAPLAVAAPVLLVSVDGLKPEYVLEAGARGLKIPYLRSLMEQGVYADGVVGVWPTVTYPSHTTLITGRAPADHGIVDNLEFDPYRRYADAWYWYAAHIRVPTLWQAAHAAGLTTASVGWPVSVAAEGVDVLIPEYWRTGEPAADTDPSDRDLIAALSRPLGLLESMQARVGPYMRGNDTSIDGDAVKTRYSLDILARRKPGFMTLHLSSLDAAEHAHGPFSAEANATLEAIDSMLAELSAAAQRNDARSIMVVVSDHGFMPLSHRVNLFVPFLQHGWIKTAPDPGTQTLTITDWQAEPWLAGGMVAIMLSASAEPGLAGEVHSLLAGLAADPKNGIAAVLDHDAILQRGGFPTATFLVVLSPGYYAGGALTGPLVTDVAAAANGEMPGGHGFSPEDAAMRAAFFATGKGLAQHRDLGVIDMRQIAPSVARLLGVALPGATAAPLVLTR